MLHTTFKPTNHILINLCEIDNEKHLLFIENQNSRVGKKSPFFIVKTLVFEILENHFLKGPLGERNPMSEKPLPYSLRIHETLVFEILEKLEVFVFLLNIFLFFNGVWKREVSWER